MARNFVINTEAAIYKDGKWLVGVRSKKESEAPGLLSFIGGTVDESDTANVDTLEHALIREVKEEIGLTLQEKNLGLKHVMHRKGTDSNDERIDFFFVCHKWDGEAKNLEPEKCDELEWYKIVNLPQNTIPYIQTAIINSLLEPKMYSEQ